MPFSYYKRLNPRQKKLYKESNTHERLLVREAHRFEPLLLALKESLGKADTRSVVDYTQKLVSHLCYSFDVSNIKVFVLERRPFNARGELHGMYQRNAEWSHPRLTVWMRTAKRENVVAFKTYLRTVVHEVAHHLDFAHFRFFDSLHTEGFYKREASLYRQLMSVIDPTYERIEVQKKQDKSFFTKIAEFVTHGKI